MRNVKLLTLALLLGASTCAVSATPQGSSAPVRVAPPPPSIAKPPPAPVHPVTETLWGRRITDNYRYMEQLDPATIAWMKAQGAYTRSVLDSIAPLDGLKHEIAAFSGSFGLVQGYVEFGGRAFYEERTPGSDNFDLIVSDHSGKRKLVDIAALRAANGGKPYAINYFLASPDGSKVAVGISEGGSEDASLTVYLAADGTKLGGPIDRAEFGATSWSEDSRMLYFIRLKRLSAGDSPTEKYKDATADAWDLDGEPTPLLGASVGHGPPFKPAEFPAVQVTVGAPLAAAVSLNGVQNEIALWLTPVASLRDPDTVWTQLLTRDDGVTGLDMRGQEIFLLSHKDAPTFQVLSMRAGQPLDSASVLVPAKPDRVIEGIHAASDALYVLTRQGAYSQLLRVPRGTKEIQDVPLPVKGHVEEAVSDPRMPGVTVTLSSWVLPAAVYAYQPASKRFADLKVGTRGAIDSSAFVVSDLEAPAADGVKVPLSLVQPKGVQGPQVTLIEAYGSYGISELADFSIRRAAAMNRGITYGLCHVRGGGELGETWRLGGKDADKHHTWEDLIACTEFLVGRGVTAADKVLILGGSAGGITVGRAITERPDLFAGAIDMVPAANTLRAEFTANGPPNVPEFGSIGTKAGFDNLYAMDSIVHIRKGTRYPAVMVTTGLNDPRVSPWEPAKLVAALQASGSSNPVLLRIDQQAGHGIGSTRAQTDALTADGIAFAFWRAGLPGWQPATP